MNSINKFLKSSKFKTTLLVVVLFCIFFPSSKLKAAYTSPGADNIISITDARTNALVYGCARSSVAGGIGSTARGLNSWLSFDDFPVGCTLDKGEGLGSLLNSPSIMNVLGAANTTIVAQRPASGLWYVQDKVIALSNIGKVDAQVKELSQINNYYPGAGADLLKPIYQFWGWSVRIVYAFMIVIIIFIAMAITFRQRLGGKAEVTLQNAIPSIAMAMIIIPLSYAISGFGIDMITIGTNAVHDFLIGYNTPGYEVGKYVREQNPTPNGEEDRGLYADDARVDWLHAREQVNLSGPLNEVGESVAQTTGLGTGAIWGLINGILNMISGNTAGANSIAWFGTIINFVISLTMIWIGVKIFFRLLKKYIFLTIVPMVSAFILAPIALPGNGIKVLVEYIKQLSAAALHFIVAYAMFLLTIIFSSEKFYSSVPAGRTGSFIPPLLGFGNLSVGGSELTHLIFILVALGIYFSIPATLEGIDKALDIKDALPSFIKTPWDSFQESWKITTRAAPAFAARTAVTGGRLARGAAYVPARAYTAVRGDMLDRLKGITPGEAGSYRAKKRTELATLKAELQDQYDRAKADGNVAGMSIAETRMKGLDAYGDMFGTGVGYQGEKDQEPKLEIVGFDLTLPLTKLPNLINDNGFKYDAATGAITGTAGTPVGVGGKLVFSSKGAGKILNPVKLEVSKAAENPTTHVWEFDDKGIVVNDLFVDRNAGVPAAENFSTVFQSSTTVAGAGGWVDVPVSAPPIIEISVSTAPLRNYKVDEKYEVVFELKIPNITYLIGTQLDPTTYNPIERLALLKTGDGLRTKDRLAFRIGSLETLGVRFTLKLA